MHTVMAMMEAKLNTRPITHINPVDVTAYPIHPMDFLSQKLSFSLSVEDSENYYDPDYNYHAINTVNQAKEVLQNINRLVEKFWNDWKTTYLTELRNSHKIRFHQGRHGRRHLPLIGEVVLIKHELSPRRMWHYGLVIELVKSSDGEIRSVKLIGPNGRTLHRPINKLYPMEIRAISPLHSMPTTDMMGNPNLEYDEENCREYESPLQPIANYEYIQGKYLTMKDEIAIGGEKQ